MKKVLVFNAPHPFDRTMVWDISEKQSRSAAYIDLFKIMNSELNSFSENPDAVCCALIDLAKADNAEACEALLCYRRNSLEFFNEIEVTSPDSPRIVEKPIRLVTRIVPMQDIVDADVQRQRLDIHLEEL